MNHVEKAWLTSTDLYSHGYKRLNFLRIFFPFLTREYAKYNEQVIGDDGKFTHSLARLLAIKKGGMV